MVIADINVGVFVRLRHCLAGRLRDRHPGWSSQFEYPFLGGVRATSQMISYELSLGLAVIPILLLLGQLR